MIPMTFPRVSAASTEPMPIPYRWPKNRKVIPAVTVRQMASKEILIRG